MSYQPVCARLWSAAVVRQYWTKLQRSMAAGLPRTKNRQSRCARALRSTKSNNHRYSPWGLVGQEIRSALRQLSVRGRVKSSSKVSKVLTHTWVNRLQDRSHMHVQRAVIQHNVLVIPKRDSRQGHFYNLSEARPATAGRSFANLASLPYRARRISCRGRLLAAQFG